MEQENEFADFSDEESLKNMMKEVAQRHLNEHKQKMNFSTKDATFFKKNSETSETSDTSDTSETSETSDTPSLERLMKDIAKDKYGYPEFIDLLVCDGSHDIPKLKEHLIPRARALLYLSMVIDFSKRNDADDYDCLIEIRSNIHNSLKSDSTTGVTDLYDVSAVFDGNFIQSRKGNIKGTGYFDNVFEALKTYAAKESHTPE